MVWLYEVKQIAANTFGLLSEYFLRMPVITKEDEKLQVCMNVTRSSSYPKA